MQNNLLCDKMNDYLEKLSPECLSDLRKKMVTSLIRGKQYNKICIVPDIESAK